MSNWKEYKLSDIADIIGGGTPSTSEPAFWNGNIPWLTPRDLTGYTKTYIGQGERSITENGLSNSSARILPKGSVLITSRAPIGYVAIAENAVCTNQGFKSLVLDNSKAKNRFIYYWVKNNVEYLQSIGTGTTFMEISGSTLRDVSIMLPPIEEQEAIAEVLSSLDDKIDLLHRQNTTLEALAQTYFRQWFVEDASENWETVKLKKLGKIVCGKTPTKRKPNYFGGDIPFIKIPDMHSNIFVFNTLDTLTEAGSRSQLNKSIPPDSICVSCIATVGLVSMNTTVSQTNQQINSIIPFDKKYRYYLFLFLRNYTEELYALGSGGTMTLNINTTLFSEIECYCPSSLVLDKFNQTVIPMFNKIKVNGFQIHTLKKLRDTLLPKLISGDINIKQKERV